MSVRNFLLSVALLSLAAGLQSAAASSTDPQTLGARADAQAERITDAEAFVAEIDRALKLARKGAYGPLKPGSTEKLKAARDVIADLLKGHATATELKPDDRIAVYNAQEQITAILRNEDKNRMICRKELEVGTRVPSNVCMTVGQREERAKRDSEATAGLMRTLCDPSSTSTCGK